MPHLAPDLPRYAILGRRADIWITREDRSTRSRPAIALGELSDSVRSGALQGPTVVFRHAGGTPGSFETIPTKGAAT